MESRKIEGTDQKSAIRPFPLKMDVQQVAEFARRHGTVASTDISHDTNRHLIRAGTLSYVLVCGLSGTAVCGGEIAKFEVCWNLNLNSGSHLLTTPLDVLKCRIQVNKAKYPSLVEAFRVTVKDEGLRGMAFKKMFFDNMTPENAYAYRTVIFALAAALAESIGDVLLAPFEAMKVRTQTDPLAPTAMRHCLPMIWKSEGVSGFFKGLVPLWSRQIPYTVSKFVAFEFAIDFLYRYLKLDRQTCDRNVQLSVSLVAGILAGITSAVCSHPPDVIISQLYKDPNATFGSIVRHLGFKGCWSGLGARVFMIGSIASMQLFTVDSVKVFFHLERPKAPEPPPSLLNSQL
ncbi:Phosphate carrier protein, mitochondrial [Aphelenchoides besseyi]|nr:Phosphate carrier protein, mitochondrial [Aphelenchoides besseyi]